MTENIDISRSSLPALAYVLRHPETWPDGFKWDFTNTNSCPIGLTVKLWGGPGFNWESDYYIKQYAIMLRTTPEVIWKLFFSIIPYAYRVFGIPVFPRLFKNVTPELAAQVIERYLATQMA